MRSVKLTALALGAMMAMGATSAFAESTFNDCREKAEQVKTALDTNQNSTNYAAAMKEKNTGQQFCTASIYRVGVDHYAAALKLLGASAS